MTSKYPDHHRFLVPPQMVTTAVPLVDHDPDMADSYQTITMGDLRAVAKAAGFTLVRTDRIKEFEAQRAIPADYSRREGQEFEQHMRHDMARMVASEAAEECGIFMMITPPKERTFSMWDDISQMRMQLTVIDRSDQLD